MAPNDPRVVLGIPFLLAVVLGVIIVLAELFVPITAEQIQDLRDGPRDPHLVCRACLTPGQVRVRHRRKWWRRWTEYLCDACGKTLEY